MTGSQIAILIAVVVGSDLIILPIVIGAMVNAYLSPLTERHPAQPRSPNAVRREFQSLKIGACSFAWSFHLAADERFLHLEPARIPRLFGAKPASIPWTEIHIMKDSSPKWIEAKIGGSTVTGPRWCLELADPTRTPRRSPSTPAA